MNLSTDSLFRKMLHSSAHSPNVSDAEELELLTKFQNLEERSRMKYKKKLDAAKKRITELEKKVSEYEAQLASMNKNKEDQTSSEQSNEDDFDEEEDNSEVNLYRKNKRRVCSQNFRLNINKSELARAKYITYLENFADIKCDEVECLINRLLELQRKRKEKVMNNHVFIQLQRKCETLSAENNQLRENFSKAKLMIEQFAISHRESKAERRTRELQELASIRAEYESKILDLYSFIATQFRQFVDIDNNGLNEKNVKAIILKAAEMLKRQYE